ncbi:MAG: hypothetical protein ACXVY5_01655, partial [Gaiellales bacterium]
QLNELLAAVQRGLGVEPERSVEMSSDVRARVRVILPLASSVLQACCATAGIASELVATRDDLESRVRRLAAGAGAGGHPRLGGGRRELAGEPLLRRLRGEVVLAVVPGPPHVAELPRA